MNCMDPLALQIDPKQLGLEFGTGGVIGLLIGFAAKKIAKIIAIIVGLELALFKFLESKGILVVNWDQIGAGFLGAGETATETGLMNDWIQPILSTLSVGAGFTGGFMIGFKKG
jgi:uncharacterized membrane protein (Fun14 family)